MRRISAAQVGVVRARGFGSHWTHTRGADEQRLYARANMFARRQEEGAVEEHHADRPKPHEGECNALYGIMLLSSVAAF